MKSNQQLNREQHVILLQEFIKSFYVKCIKEIIIPDIFELTLHSLYLSHILISQVDVDKSAPIPAFCSSDEEEEEKDALLYLPIAPEIEDPEENWVPGVDPPPDEESPLGPSKRNSSANNDYKENTSPKKKRTKTTDIILQDYPKDGKLIFTLSLDVFGYDLNLLSETL